MPIRPDLRHFYRGSAWLATRERIRGRALGQCEHCGKPHNQWILVTRDGTGRWNRKLPELLFGPLVTHRASFLVAELLLMCRTAKHSKAARDFWYQHWMQPGNPCGNTAEAPELGRVYLIRRALTVAHVNHTPGDDRDENLLALCEYCHLHFDQEHHRDVRAARKDAARPLLLILRGPHG